MRNPNLIERIGLALAGPWLREAGGSTIDPDDDLYRGIGANRRDVSDYTIARARRLAIHLWRTNPLAHRVTELIADFTVGADPLIITAEDDRTQQIIDEFWGDPRVAFGARLRSFVRDLSLYGELAFRVFRSEAGRVRLGLIDPDRIRDVILDPDDALVDRQIEVSTPTGAPAVLDCVTWDDTTGRYVGDVLYFAINRLAGQKRGVPDLYALVDYIDAHDQLLFGAVERSRLLGAFIYDVTLQGADDIAIQQWVARHGTTPRPGSVRVHNERETWKAEAPDLQAADFTSLIRAVKNVALGGAGIPEAWFAEGDSANRATLVAQGDPTYRMLQARQREVQRMVERIITVVIQHQLGRRLPEAQETPAFAIHMPDISMRDTSLVSQALAQLVPALNAAIAESLVDRRNARRLFLVLAGQLGVDLDEDEIENAIAEEKASEQNQQNAELTQRAALLGQLARVSAQGGDQPPSEAPEPQQSTP